MKDFITPPGHTGFLAKQLFGHGGQITFAAIGYIEKGGGGPVGGHSHNDDHLFIVTDGEVRITMGDENVVLKKNDSLYVDGSLQHSIWNDKDKTAVVVKINLTKQSI